VLRPDLLQITADVNLQRRLAAEADAPGFIAAQLTGALVATLFFRWLVPALTTEAKDVVVPRRQDLGTS
jgi:glycerol uptake facilitator-like aquaporin